MITEKEILTLAPAEAIASKETLSRVSLDGCPNCSSSRVRWRKRRFYDVILTWLVAGLLSSGMYAQYDDMSWPSAYYVAERPIENPSISWATPRRFWRCPDCGQRGDEM
jgi:hypothetical protein